MRLTQASDFALRILMLVAVSTEALTVEAVAARLGLPKSHVMKLVAQLARGGFLVTTRGRGGGIRLAGAAEAISVGQVVRLIEPDVGVVECLVPGSIAACCFLPACALKPAMASAAEAFLRALDPVTLRQILPRTAPAATGPARTVAAGGKPLAPGFS